MKKLIIIAVVLAVGVTVGFASSLKVPWFIDTAKANDGVPGTSGRVTGLITLASNRTDELVCSITYYSADGDNLGPDSPNNTFTIKPLSSLAFRPVAYDPDATVTGGGSLGQEGAQAILVPDRPRDVDTKKNGSCVVQWVGDPTDVQGQVAYYQSASDGQSMSYAHLLPPGA